MPLIYTVIDIQSLISAALIFTTFLYYPMRMIISPRYARRFWQQECLPWLAPQYRSFTLYWFIALAVILTLLCAPYQSEFIAADLHQSSWSRNWKPFYEGLVDTLHKGERQAAAEFEKATCY